MDKDRWTKVQTLFERALEVDVSRRDAYLRKECGDDVELYKDVLALLEMEKLRNRFRLWKFEDQEDS